MNRRTVKGGDEGRARREKAGSRREVGVDRKDLEKKDVRRGSEVEGRRDEAGKSEK